MIYQGARRRWLVLVITAIFVLSLALPAAAAGPDRVKPGAGGEPPGDFVPGEVIVKFKEGVRAAATMQTLAAKHRAFGLAAVRVLPYEAALFTTTTDVTAAVAALQRDPRVEFAQPNYIYRALGAPDDPLWDQQWGMHASDGPPPHHPHGVRALEAWTHTKGSADIVVAVIDTGIDYTHEDLAANMWTNPGEILGDRIDNDGNSFVDDYYGYDFIGANARNPQPDSDPLDDDGHGTHVAGIVAATANNAKGIAGTAPGVRLMAVKALDSGGFGTTAAIVNAINYAATNGAQVVNMSFGGTGFDPLQYKAIAAHPGVLFVAAAGNGGSDGIGDNNDTNPVSPASFTIDWNIDTNDDGTSEHFPALPHLISVAALAPNGNLTTFSNFGATSVDLAAPGDAIVSTVPQWDGTPPSPYAAWDGTSMAAPFVAAGGALVLSLRPDLAPASVIDLLNNNVTELASALTGKVASGGTLNLARALAAVPPGVKSTVPAHGATGVAVNTNITVTFSESVTKGVYFDGITISGGGTTVSHTYGLSGSMLTLNPDANLAHSTVYTVTIPAGAVQDAAGNPSDAHSFSFTTQAAGGGGGGGGGAPAPPAPPEAPGPPAGTGEFTATGGAQSVSLLDGQVTLDLPAGALPEGAKVTVTLAADTPENLPAGAKAVSAVFSFKSTAPLAKPVRVSIRYEADKLGGLDPQALMVFRENPDGTWQRVGGKLDRAAQAVVVELDGFSSYTVLGTPKTFGDIKGHWAQADIELLAARGLVQGRAAGKFAPGAPVTRAEMAALLVRLTGAKEVTPAQPAFTDVAPGAWYYSAIETAVRAGLFKGYADGSFQPDATLTREQLAALAVRLTGAATGTTQLPFADRAAIAPWAEEAVAAAYAQGLLRGVSDTEFAPQMSVTRAQAATIMVRLAERKGLFEVTITATGTLVWNTLVGGFWELAADQETYVLLPDPRHKAAAAQLKQFENQEITVTGYIQTGPNIYMRGPLLRILNVTPTG